MIKPTIGRKLWYKPTEAEQEAFICLNAQMPFDATVIYVHFDDNVNLRITDHHGNTFSREDVYVCTHEGEEAEEGQAYWMPYQHQQAKA